MVRTVHRRRVQERRRQTACGKSSRSTSRLKSPARLRIDEPGEYRIVVEGRIDGHWEFDPGRCRIACDFDGKQLFQDEYEWRDDLAVPHETDAIFDAGEYPMSFELKPLVPVEQKLQYLDYRVDASASKVRWTRRHWVPPPNYTRFFPDGPPPAAGPERDAYARKVLSRFATRAFRRPVDEALGRPAGRHWQDRLRAAGQEDLKKASARRWSRCSRRRDSCSASKKPDRRRRVRRIRWWTSTRWPRGCPISSGPRCRTKSCIDLAERGRVARPISTPSSTRMLADPRSEAFVANFTGQWLQARDVETISIDPVAALGYQKEWEAIQREVSVGPRRIRRGDGEWKTSAIEKSRKRRNRAIRPPSKSCDGIPTAVGGSRAEERRERDKSRAEFRQVRRLREKFGDDVRRAMRRETEMSFDYVMREDRSLLELIDSDYTFLNEKLAKHYGIPGVEGNEMRRVELPEGQSPRRRADARHDAGRDVEPDAHLAGQARPVRARQHPRHARPAAAERRAAARSRGRRGRRPSSRRSASCSTSIAAIRSAPAATPAWTRLGWRWKTSTPWACGATPNTTGRSMRPASCSPAKSFRRIRDLKKVLKNEHQLDFYRCLTEKLLTYALGRGLEYYDEQTVDQIVEPARRGGRPVFGVAARGGRVGAVPAATRDRRSPTRDQQARSRPLRRFDARNLSHGGRRHDRDKHAPSVHRSSLDAAAFPARRRRVRRAARVAVARCRSAAWRRKRQRSALQPPRLPLRMAFVTFPNGCNLDNWWPTGEGERVPAQRDDGAARRASRTRFKSSPASTTSTPTPGPDGAGDHARASATLLTGGRARKTAGADIQLGVSVDQVAAAARSAISRGSRRSS